MNKYAELTIKYEDLVKIILTYLIQDENVQAPNNEDVEYELSAPDDAHIYIFDWIMIGEVKGKLKEEIFDETIGAMILEYTNADDYIFDSIKYVPDSGGKALKEVKVALLPKEEKSFVKEMKNEVK